jgi:predicted kinase
MESAAGGQLLADVKRLAESLGELPGSFAPPVLVIVSGLPGTGKSHFSARLAKKLDFVILESDALRKLLFPSPVYSKEESSYLFQIIHRLLEQLLKKGASVILDATNLSESHREHLYHIAERCHTKLFIVEVKAPPLLVYNRLKRRHSAQNKEETKSDADWEVYRQMKPTVEKIRRRHYSIDTSQDISHAIDKVVRDIKSSRRETSFN